MELIHYEREHFNECLDPDAQRSAFAVGLKEGLPFESFVKLFSVALRKDIRFYSKQFNTSKKCRWEKTYFLFEVEGCHDQLLALVNLVASTDCADARHRRRH